MMHNSLLGFQHQSVKKEKLTKELHCKNIGTYINLPLPDKVLSNKSDAGRTVFKAIVVGCPSEQQKQYLNAVPTQAMTMKILNLQKLSDQNIQVKKQFRRHLRIDIKQYLKRKYQKQTYQLPLQACQILRIYKQKQKQGHYNTKFLHIYKPFYLNGNIKRLQQTNYELKRQIFKKQQLPNFFRELLKCSVQFGGLDNFIMTTSNVYLDQDLTTLQLNYTSFAGLSFVKSKSKIGVHQYFQIGPYLTKNMILNGEIGVQQKIRFFLINCMCIINGRDFFFEKQHPLPAQKIFTYDQIRQQFIKNNQLAPQLISNFTKQIKGEDRHKKRMQYCQKFKIPEMLEKVIIKNQPVTWEYIIQSICLGDGQKVDEQYGKFIQKAFRDLHDTLWREQQNQEFYKQRNLQSYLLYVPIKYRAKLNLVFSKKVWWEIFNIRTQKNKADPKLYNFQHQNFCYALLGAVVDRYYRKQKTQEQAKAFKQDPVIQIIFQYLKASELESITQIRDGKQKKFIHFSQIYQRYNDLVQKMKSIKTK